MIFVIDDDYAIEAKSLLDARNKWIRKKDKENGWHYDGDEPKSIVALTDQSDRMSYWVIKHLAEVNEQKVTQQSTPTHHRRHRYIFRHRRRH